MSGKLFDLRPVQEKALDMLKGALKLGKRRPQLQLPTGVGKTIIAAHAATGSLRKGNRTAFTVPLLSLIDQTVERFVENGISLEHIGVVQADHPLRRPHAPIQICSVETLAKREFPSVEFVMVDESHIQHKTIYEWMDLDPKRIFIGLSATPWAKGMAEHYDDLLIPTTLNEMIKAGDLCDFKAFAPTKPDLSAVPVTAGEYQINKLSETMQQKWIVADVVTTWLDRADNRPTLLYAVDRAHAAKLHDQFAESGVNSAYVDAYTDREEREAVKKLFHRGDIKVVCSVGTMIAGIDWDVRAISWCRPSKSPILFVQGFGRGLRTAKGKDYLLFLDHSNTTLELGLPTEINFPALRSGKKDSGESKAKKKKLPSPRECPKCKEIVAATERNCPCGHVFKYVSKVVTRDGELEELNGTAAQQRNRSTPMTDKVIFYGQLKWYAASHGFKSGWASMKYRERFNVWPNDERIRYAPEVQPSNETLSWIRSRQIAWAKRKPGTDRAEVGFHERQHS